MGKIRTRLIGIEEVEEQQKKEQKLRSAEKKRSAVAEAKADKGKKDVILGSEATPESKKEDPGQARMTEKPKKDNKKQEKNVPPSPKLHRARGKKYQEALKKVDQNKLYSVEEAVNELKKIAFAKFEESVELHLNVVKEGLRGEVELPHSTGKTVRIAIVDEALLEKLEKGVIDFDILIAHPSFMPRLAKYAKSLGPKGLMPNPKAGTISPNPEETAKKFEKGTLRWKAESKFPLVHQMVAKLTHDTKAITENVVAFLNSVGTKNIKAAYIKSTMSPSLQLKLEEM